MKTYGKVKLQWKVLVLTMSVVFGIKAANFAGYDAGYASGFDGEAGSSDSLATVWTYVSYVGSYQKDLYLQDAYGTTRDEPDFLYDYLGLSAFIIY